MVWIFPHCPCWWYIILVLSWHALVCRYTNCNAALCDYNQCIYIIYTIWSTLDTSQPIIISKIRWNSLWWLHDMGTLSALPLQWRHNGRDSVSYHQPNDCLLNGLFRRRSKKASKLRVTGLCAGNSPVTDEFPAQMASYAENVSIGWRHHALLQWVMNVHLYF